jgi:hypothetical protein
MSGASDKKAAKAHAKAAKKYKLYMMAANGAYVLGRLLPGYLGWINVLSTWGVLRWLLSLVIQWVTSMFLCDAEVRNISAGKNDSGSDGEHFFDAFALISIVQVLAVAEFWLRGSEKVWWLSTIVPIGAAYVAYTAMKGSKLPGMLGFGSGSEKAEEADPEMEAKRKRRQDLKLKRSSAGVRK